ncbi:MAG: phenylalanine--tRNA ligase subunit alpha [Acidimicrobiales bacterium]
MTGSSQPDQRLVERAVIDIEGAVDLADLDRVAAGWTGRGSELALRQSGLGRLPAAERPAAGAALNRLRHAIESLVGARRATLADLEGASRLAADRLDLTESRPAAQAGHLHPVTQARQELEDLFIGMGYRVAEGPEVESDWHNFEALNMPPDHPARSMWDTLYVNLGVPESTLLRTHTSPVQVRVMLSQPPPLAVIAPGRCYRRDTPDASHLPVFHQIEGLVIDEGITFADLAGTIDAFTTAYFGADVPSRLRPAYFPFTEPSAEFEVRWQRAGSDQPEWLELGGCGMVDPAVFEAVGIDPDRWSGFAFGFGIDRLTMLRHGLDDMRHLLTNDVRFLTQF